MVEDAPDDAALGDEGPEAVSRECSYTSGPMARSTSSSKNAPFPFLRRVVGDFRKNQGFILASAVAYNSLLSLVPLFAVLLVVLSHFVEEQRLLGTVSTCVDLLLPGGSPAITEQVAALLSHPHMIAGVGGLALLFFSSIAFTVLENAMSVIFFHRLVHRRHFLLSAVLPYLFILALGTGLLLVTIISGVLQVVGQDVLQLFGREWRLAGFSRAMLWFLGVTGLALLLTSLYMVMPIGRLSFRHALAGGVTATALWEVVRRVLAWYFSTLSMVNVVYGPLAGTIGVLLSLEAAALVLLLGAQVIAELERSRWARSGVPRSGQGTSARL
jgi:YihY family inner membrane protein